MNIWRLGLAVVLALACSMLFMPQAIAAPQSSDSQPFPGKWVRTPETPLDGVARTFTYPAKCHAEELKVGKYCWVEITVSAAPGAPLGSDIASRGSTVPSASGSRLSAAIALCDHCGSATLNNSYNRCVSPVPFANCTSQIKSTLQCYVAWDGWNPGDIWTNYCTPGCSGILATCGSYSQPHIACCTYNDAQADELDQQWSMPFSTGTEHLQDWIHRGGAGSWNIDWCDGCY